MDQNLVMAEIKAYISIKFQKDKSGHDLAHMDRVRNYARMLAVSEGLDSFLPEVIALCHDICDHKLTEDEEGCQKELLSFLSKLGFSLKETETIQKAIHAISFSKGLKAESKLEQVVQDADRLDAIGAMGIIRALQYGFSKNRDLSLTIQHFDDKLFKIKDLLHTRLAKEIAEDKHVLMLAFYNQYQKESEQT